MNYCMVGIDPGATGAAAVVAYQGVSPEPRGAEIIEIIDFNGDNDTCVRRILGAIHAVLGKGRDFKCNGRYNLRVTVELQRVWQAGPKSQGTVSSTKIVQEFGWWLGWLFAHDFPAFTPRPVDWKRQYHLLKQDKKASIIKALQFFPDAAPCLRRVKDHNRAEALLLADCGYCGDVRAVVGPPTTVEDAHALARRYCVSQLVSHIDGAE